MREQFFGNTWLYYVNFSKTTLWSVNGIMSWRSIAVQKEQSKELGNMTMKLEISERQRQVMANSKRPVVRLAPLFYESVFREKNRADNVGASHQQAKKVDLEHGG